MLDMSFNNLLDSFLNSPGAKGAAGGAASGALVSLLMNKKARKGLGKTAVKVGGAAAIAGVGYFAYKKWQESRNAAAPVSRSDTPQLSHDPGIGEPLAATILKAMIAAASADGHFADVQMDAVLDALEQADLTPSEKQEITRSINQPATVEDISAQVGDLEQASEVYAACLMVFDPAVPAETLFLRRLSRAMQMPAELVQRLHADAAQLTAS
jgi:uncharacterized membrane protein YebE (DUF533 family)